MDRPSRYGRADSIPEILAIPLDPTMRGFVVDALVFQRGFEVRRERGVVMRWTKRAGFAIVAAAAALSIGLSRTPVAVAVGTIDPLASALDLARAIADPAVVTGAAFVARPPGGSPTAVATQAAAGFPRSGGSYAILSTGDATILTNANTSTSSGANDGGGAVRGNTDRDVTILRIDFVAPSGANCLAGLDFRFLSEEYPEYVGSSYDDAFIAELDQSTWTTSGSSIVAPRNFAFDPQGAVISINSSGATSMSAAYAETTTFDGATPVLSAATPLTPGAHSLFLSIFDQGDNIYDSAVVIDNLRFSTVANTATQCVPGATVTNLPRPLLGAHGITGVPADMDTSLGVARSVVTGLVTHSVNTGAIDSVWQNGLTVFQEARDEAGKAGKRVNVIAHSKGGLDSRVAMWEHPQYFNMLGMLSHSERRFHGRGRGLLPAPTRWVSVGSAEAVRPVHR